MACWAAGQQRIKEAVDIMIDMLAEPQGNKKGEIHPRVTGVLLYNLEDITGQTQFGLDVSQWRIYWERNKDKTLPKVKRFDVGTFGEVKNIQFNDTFARRGTGPLMIVMPIQHRSTLYYKPAGESDLNLHLMRLIDKQYTKTPFYGWPKMTACLRRQAKR